MCSAWPNDAATIIYLTIYATNCFPYTHVDVVTGDLRRLKTDIMVTPPSDPHLDSVKKCTVREKDVDVLSSCYFSTAPLEFLRVGHLIPLLDHVVLSMLSAY